MLATSAAQRHAVADLTKLDERIAGIQEQLQKLRTRRQRIQARQDSLAARRRRNDDTRRKILVGAIVLAKVDRGEIDKTRMREWLGKELTRAADRALFDLDGS